MPWRTNRNRNPDEAGNVSVSPECAQRSCSTPSEAPKPVPRAKDRPVRLAFVSARSIHRRARSASLAGEDRAQGITVTAPPKRPRITSTTNSSIRAKAGLGRTMPSYGERPRERSFIEADGKSRGHYLPEAESPSSKTLRFDSRCLGGASSFRAATTRSRSRPAMPMPLAAPRIKTLRKR